MGICQQTRRDLLGKCTGEGIVILHIAIAYFSGTGAEGEVALRPELRFAGTSGIAPGSARFVGGAAKRPRWSSTMHITIRVASQASKALIAQSTNQQVRPSGASRLGGDRALFPHDAQRGELLGEPLAPCTI